MAAITKGSQTNERILVTNSLSKEVRFGSSFLLSLTNLENTILDPRVSVSGGYILSPINIPKAQIYIGNPILIPKKVGQYNSINGTEDTIMYLSSIQRAYDALVDLILRYTANPKTNRGLVNSINKILRRIKIELQNDLSGKSGDINSFLFRIPLPYSGRAVLSADIHIEPNECRIPYNVLWKFVQNEDFRKEFNIPLGLPAKEAVNHLKGKRIIIGRQPTHRVSNMLALKIRGFSEYSVHVNPAIDGFMDADHDGDQVWFALEKDTPEVLYIENQMDMYIPVKEFERTQEFGLNPIVTYEDLAKLCKEYRDHPSLKSFTPNIPDSYPGYNPGKYLIGISWPEQMKADVAKTYHIIKTDTAKAGGITNMLLSLGLEAEVPFHDIKMLTLFRHTLCQLTLECKHGLDNYRGGIILQQLSNILYRQKQHSSDFIKVISDLEKDHRVLTAIRKTLKTFDGKSISESFVKSPELFVTKRNRKVTDKTVAQIIQKVGALS